MKPQVIVLYGGVGSERNVSLSSGANMIAALEPHYPVKGIELKAAVLPPELKPWEEVVFPALHGEFGEDGTLQQLLDRAGIVYAGCDADSSRTCMDKQAIKEIAQNIAIPVAKGICVAAGESLPVPAICREIGDDLVVKPCDQGSSVGVAFIQGASELAHWWDSVEDGRWLIEERIRGRELTVGLLHGKAQGLVEIISTRGFYDYEAKYTPGYSRYEFPAKLDDQLTSDIQQLAERIFAQAGCRDFARVDFLLAGEKDVRLLEINTIPGLTATSLLPKSASCKGYDFEQLAVAMLQPAIARFEQRYGSLKA
jgi:D-alanine-D-alanine ligase